MSSSRNLPENRDSQSGSALAERWKQTLAGIETVLGRLEYLASLRNPHSGVYEHFGLSERIGATETDHLLRSSHANVFQEWLALPQQDQREQAEAYLDGFKGDRREIVSNWIALQPYANWLPAESRDIERELFLTDLGDVVESIRAEYRVASRDPEL